jgi:hypothetical protein
MRTWITSVAIAAFACFLLGASADNTPTTQPAKTGEFDINFTQRSPESDYEKLVARIGLTKDKLGPDYELSQEG